MLSHHLAPLKFVRDQKGFEHIPPTRWQQFRNAKSSNPRTTVPGISGKFKSASITARTPTPGECPKSSAKALATIRDGDLYPEEQGTFAAYCLDRWDLTEMAEDLPKIARNKGKPVPAVEAAVA
ncbi:hypothetical protein ACYOEI_01625 [Singulisphaera rosea]